MPDLGGKEHDNNQWQTLHQSLGIGQAAIEGREGREGRRKRREGLKMGEGERGMGNGVKGERNGGESEERRE